MTWIGALSLRRILACSFVCASGCSRILGADFEGLHTTAKGQAGEGGLRDVLNSRSEVDASSRIGSGSDVADADAGTPSDTPDLRDQAIEGLVYEYATGQPTALTTVPRAPGRYDIFVRDSGGNLFIKSWWGNAWYPSQFGWISMGGHVEGSPRAVSWGANRVDIFARQSDGNLYVKSWLNERWNPSQLEWDSLGAPAGARTVGRPSGVSWAADRLHIVVAASDGHVYLKARNGADWLPSRSEWIDMGGPFVGSPTLVARGSSQLHLFARTPNGQLQTKTWVGTDWAASATTWQTLGAPENASVAGNPEAASSSADRLHVVVGATDGNVYLKAWDFEQSVPSQDGWTNMGPAIGAPQIVSLDVNHIDVFVRQSDGSVGTRSWKGTTWDPPAPEWKRLGLAAGLPLSTPMAISSCERNFVTLFTLDVNQFVQGKGTMGGDWLPSTEGWDPFGGPFGLDLVEMIPFWSTTTMYDESALAMSGGSEGPRAKLLWPASEIVSVRSASLGTEYQRDVDWTYDPASNTLALPKGSHAAQISDAELAALSSASPPGHGLHDRQLMVTYRHSRNLWTGPVPKTATGELANSLTKLKNKATVKIALYGDDIAQGYSASGFGPTMAPPFRPSWGEWVVRQLRKAYGAPVELDNRSNTGATAAWGLQNVNSLAQAAPDLVILAFGLFDGLAGAEAAVFERNIRGIIDAVRGRSPASEFILVSPLVPNRKHAVAAAGRQRDYVPALEALAREKGCAFVDMTAVYDELLRHKSASDMTGDDNYRPNDFLIRWYAQMTAGLLLDSNK